MQTRQRFWLKALIATLLMLVAVLGMTALGIWQYSVAHRDEIAKQVLAAAPVPIENVLKPGEFVREKNYGSAVLVTGEISCSDGYVSTNSGLTKPWQVCRARLANGASVAVVVGYAAKATPTLVIMDGSISGRLQPAQGNAPAPAIYGGPSKRVDIITTADNVLRWQSDTLDGYVVALPGTAAEFGLVAVGADQLLLPPAGIELRNLFYAWQWWAFTLFALFMWGRYLRDEWSSRADATE